MSGPVTSHLIETIDRELRSQRVVVWYDAPKAFESLVRNLGLEHAETIRLRESYFEVRKNAEQITSHLRGGIADGPNLLLYVPRARVNDSKNLLYPVECLGGIIETSLESAAVEAMADNVPRSRIAELTNQPGITLEELDELLRENDDIGPLATVFDNILPEQVGEKLLQNPQCAAAVLERNLFSALSEILDRTYGVKLPDVDNEPATIRDSFAHRVLLNEFLDDLDEIPEELSHFTLPEQRSQIDACRNLARFLRHLSPLEETYLDWANTAKRIFNLAVPDYDPEKIGRRDTFEFEERLALGHVQTLAEQNQWYEASEWITDRSHSFWARTDDVRRGQWLAAERATEVWTLANRLLELLPTQQPPSAWVDLYVGASDNSAWRVDQASRRLDTLSLNLLDYPQISEIAEAARAQAHELERLLAERFIDGLEGSGGDLPNVPLQVDIFRRSVAPLLGERKVVLVLADALRYEMAGELANSLRGSGVTEMNFALATPPTITVIGMAALIPGAEDGIELVADDNRIVPVIGNQRIGDLRARLRRYHAEYGDRVTDITLTACLSDSREKLETLIEQNDLILLRYQGIDAIGELDNLHHARTIMGNMTPDLHAAIKRLARAGANEFVITADHGYLLREDISDAMKLDPPDGDVIEKHRRCIIGRNLARGEHHVVFRAADLGLGGDLELAFPRGVNVFKVSGGNLAYLHGGLSLQEAVVPILRYTPEAVEATAGVPIVEIELTGEEVRNAFFQVVLRFGAGDLFDQGAKRRFRVTVTKDGEMIGHTVGATPGFREAAGEVELGVGEESVLMLQLTEPPEAGSGTLHLQVADAEVGETITSEEVTYELAF